MNNNLDLKTFIAESSDFSGLLGVTRIEEQLLHVILGQAFAKPITFDYQGLIHTILVFNKAYRQHESNLAQMPMYQASLSILCELTLIIGCRRTSYNSNECFELLLKLVQERQQLINYLKSCITSASTNLLVTPASLLLSETLSTAPT